MGIGSLIRSRSNSFLNARVFDRIGIKDRKGTAELEK